MAMFVARDQDSYQITPVASVAAPHEARQLVERRIDDGAWFPVAVCSTLDAALRYVKEFAP